MRWIKLCTSILDWEWSDDPKMMALWVHLLFQANYKDERWHGMVIKRGQLVTGRKALSELTGISERTIRTCLARLVETGEITIKSTNKYSIITICKYSIYQGGFDDGRPATDQQLTSNRPATDQQLTTLVENIERVDSRSVESVRTHARTHEEAFSMLFQEQIAVESLCMKNNISLDICKQLAREVLNDWTLSGKEHSDVRDARTHLLNLLRIKINIYKRQNDERDKQNSGRSDGQVGRQQTINEAAKAIASLAAESGKPHKLPY